MMLIPEMLLARDERDRHPVGKAGMKQVEYAVKPQTVRSKLSFIFNTLCLPGC